MKNYLPSILSLSILVGIVTFILSINYLTRELKLDRKVEEGVRKIPFIKYQSKGDTITLSTIATAIPKIDTSKTQTDNKKEEKSKIQTDNKTQIKSEDQDPIYFYLNIFPSSKVSPIVCTKT